MDINTKVSENLKKYFKEISDKVTKLIKKSKGRYFAYMVVSDTETCRAEGWEYEINYKEFDDSNQISALERYGYSVIDKENL